MGLQFHIKLTVFHFSQQPLPIAALPFFGRFMTNSIGLNKGKPFIFSQW